MTRTPTATAYIGLGSNLDGPEQQLQQAIDKLCAANDIEVQQCSSFYRSAPVGYADQDDFINAVCSISTQLSPQALLQVLMELEQQQKRERSGPVGGPRTLDLDILLYDDLLLDTPELCIPHPRMHERAFVLYPLAELDPDIEIPGKAPINDLIDACCDQRIERI